MIRRFLLLALVATLNLNSAEARGNRASAGAMTRVYHDATLANTGRSGSPLGVVAGSVAPAAHAATHRSNGSDPIAAATNSLRGTILIANDNEVDPTKALMSNDGRLLATTAEKTDLTDGGNTGLHYHDADRARSNHTGTQLLATISDVSISVADLNTLDDAANTALHFHTADRARAVHTGTQTRSTISDFAHASTHVPGGGDTIQDGTTAQKGILGLAANEEANPAEALKADDDRLLATGAERVDLTDTGNTGLHYHDADRARSVHTGTQLKSTISDFAHAATHVPGGGDAIASAVPGVSAGLMPALDALKTSVLWTRTVYTDTQTIGLTVHLAVVTTTGSNVGLTLPSAVTKGAGAQLIIKDEGGGASANNITLTPSGGQTVDGAATYVLSTNYGSVTLESNGANWFTI